MIVSGAGDPGEVTSADMRSNSGYSSVPDDTSIGKPFSNIRFTPAVAFVGLLAEYADQRHFTNVQ